MADLYCLCRQPYQPLQFMIQCDICEDWFHGSCVGIEEHQAPDIETYHCPNCTPKYGPLTLKKRRNWHRHDYSELDNGSQAAPGQRPLGVQTGTVVFIKELKNRKFASGEDLVTKTTGNELSVEFFERNGFKHPILVDDPDGLGVVLPKRDFSILDVENYVGSMREIDVIDVSRQEDYKMKMREWAEYFMDPRRNKTMNVISLEFSKTNMSRLVQVPRCVRQLDWVATMWPTDLPEDSPHQKPFVQKYCLMGVKDSYTDFHVDFGGTSVWYHVMWGEKVFYFVEPTTQNLLQYEKWVKSSNQSEMFFGDYVDKCYKLCVKKGQTLFIPTGWIHAVYTPKDTLVFGGNFLHSLNIKLQLEIYDLEIRLKTPEKFLFPYYESVNWYAAAYILDQIKSIHESGNKAPPHLTTGVHSLLETLKKWTAKKEDFIKFHKFFVPEGINPNKLIKSLTKELKKDEKPLVLVDSEKPVIKIKNPKSFKMSQVSPPPQGPHCSVDEHKPVIRIATGSTGTTLKGQDKSQMPRLKLKIPKSEAESVNISDVPGAETGLKVVLSNGKIRSNKSANKNNYDEQLSRSISGDHFQPLLEAAALVSGENWGQNNSAGNLSSSLSSTHGSGIFDSQKIKTSVQVHGLASLASSAGLRSSNPVDNNPFMVDQSMINASNPLWSQRACPESGMFTSQSAQQPGNNFYRMQPIAPGTTVNQRNSQGMLSRSSDGSKQLHPRGPVHSLKSSQNISNTGKRKRTLADESSDSSSEEEQEEGYKDNIQEDRDYVYPSLVDDSTYDEDTHWKPGQKKKALNKRDVNWNPKSKVVPTLVKEPRPSRAASRRLTAEPVLQNQKKEKEKEKSHTLIDTPLSGVPLSSPPPGHTQPQEHQTQPSSSDASTASKRGRKPQISTTRQRLAKILKLDRVYKRK